VDATFTLSELVLPGTYINVLSEGLIGAPAVSSGTIGIVGTASEGVGSTHLIGSYNEGVAAFGNYDAYASGAGTLNLTRSLEIMFTNGAGAVYARGVATGADTAAYTAAFTEVLKDDVNILIAPDLSTSDAVTVLGSAVTAAEQSHAKDVIAVIGSGAAADAEVTTITGAAPENDRIIFVAPGLMVHDAADTSTRDPIALPGTYSAAAVAGLLATLTPQSSPTNKVLPGVTALARRFTYSEQVALIKGRVLPLDQRGGVRVVRGVTTDDAAGAFRQVTTRRIVDFAKAGIRGVSSPFIGRLNNQRVRKALQGAIDGFLTGMLVDEALTGYKLAVTATRQDEIQGRAIVNVVLQPTFSIDFVAVTLVLQ
jgi:hypothetical protein